MSEPNIEAAVIKATQEKLGKYVKKPPLSEKLLRKPPFRFLFDLFTAVIKETGYFDGLYSADELNFENIKDREDKVRFLQKMIDVIKLMTEATLAVRPSKIVAGQEPEKTNELLQRMGEVIAEQLDWKHAVEQVLSGNAVPKEAIKKANKASEKPKEIKNKEKPKEKAKERDKEKAKEGTKQRDREQEKKSDKAKGKDKDRDHEKAKERKETKVGTKMPAAPQPDRVVSKEKDKDKPPSKAATTVTTKEKRETKENTKTKSSSVTRKPEPSLSKKPSVEKSASQDRDGGLSSSQSSEPVRSVEATTVSNEPSTQQGPPKRHTSSTRDEAKAELVGGHRIQPEPESETQNSTAPPHNGSAGKSRHSSAGHLARASTENADDSLHNLESLNTLAEEAPPAIAPAPLSSVPATPAPPAAMPTPPTEPLSPPVAVASSVRTTNPPKRDTALARETSKDNSETSTTIVRPRTSLRPPSARPPSARPGAPRRRDKNVEIVLQPNDPVKVAGIHVKLETFGDLDDDGENLVIIEDPSAEQMDPASLAEESLAANEVDKLEQQGHLVQQILQTQKQLVQQAGTSADESDTPKQTDKSSTGNRGARQSTVHHMNSLRDVIQSLSKSVNPYGALLDFIPEDIDAMQLELGMWRELYLQAATELRREKSLTETAIEPMKHQLDQIEATLREYSELIDASRAKIFANADKILKLLTEP